MSWTVDPPKEGTPLRKRFDEVLALAAEKRILMFCSSSDAGNYSEEHYPIKYNEKLFFKIGAAKADGHPYSWVGPADKLDYLFPGVEVVQRRGRNKAATDVIDDWKAETGSSISTALAAGLAALIISLVSIGARYWEDETEGSNSANRGLEKKDFEELQRLEKMKGAFDRCNARSQSGYTFLQIWGKLDGVTALLKNLHGKENVNARKKVVAELARDLISQT